MIKILILMAIHCWEWAILVTAKVVVYDYIIKISAFDSKEWSFYYTGMLIDRILVNNGKYFFTCLHKSPSQIHKELDTFCSNVDLLLSNLNDNHPSCSILIDDFNAKCSKWCSSDKGNKAELDWTISQVDNVLWTWQYRNMSRLQPTDK